MALVLFWAFSAWTFHFCLHGNQVSAAVVSYPLVVQGYDSYLDVQPLKYDVAPGTSSIVFNLQTFRRDEQCPAKQITILIQHGGLPHVLETNSTFPANFVLDKLPWVYFLEKEQAVTITVSWPAPGSWFVVAFTTRDDKSIQQKGLTESDGCLYMFSSGLGPEISVSSSVIDYKGKHEVTIGNSESLFRFMIPPSTMRFTIKVTRCVPSPCNLTLGYLLYDQSVLNLLRCEGPADDCQMEVVSPPLQYMHFLGMKHEQINKTQRVTFSFQGKECASWGRTCRLLPKLDRQEFSRPWFTSFVSPDMLRHVVLADLRYGAMTVIPFDLLDPNDIGATLSWTIIDVNFVNDNETATVSVCGALIHNYLPDATEDFDLCTNSSYAQLWLNLTASSQVQSNLYYPYPRAGPWHMVLQASCYSHNSSKIVCPATVTVRMWLNLQACLSGGCSGKGTCATNSITSDMVYYAACQCDAKYRGYACTDDTYAQSVSDQLAGAYLLTMSNFFFIPAIILAVRRRFFVEAFVYFYNMFFSTFYHACDGIRLDMYRLCITKYDVLQTGDFFGSACSLWFTLIAMSCIRYKYVIPVLQILGPFCLLIGVVYDKTSLFVIVVPIGCGVCVIIASWGHKMYIRRRLYPGKFRYLFFLLPALVLAATGAAIFSFLETEDNYQYVHSAWHMCIALSICLFLPPRHTTEAHDKMLESQSNSLSVQQLNPVGEVDSISRGVNTNLGFVGDS